MSYQSNTCCQSTVELSSELAATFGDERLTKRCSKLVTRLAKTPDLTINASLSTHAETLSAYRFFANPKVTPNAMLKTHRESSLARVGQYPALHVIQDTTEFDFTRLRSLQGAGPVAGVERRGAFLHASLLCAPGGLALGVRDLNFMVRNDSEHKVKHAKRKKLPIEAKESYRWLQGYRDACEIQQLLPGVNVISVGDRESDIYEIFAEYVTRRQQGATAAHFVIRAKEDRALIGEHEGNSLFDLVNEGGTLGSIEFEVPNKTKLHKIKGSTHRYYRKGRLVKQELRVHKISPRAPYRAEGKLPEVTLWMVSAIEIAPPAGQKPISWTILTSQAVESFEQAQAVIDTYLDRWQIEVFFRTLKTGCKVESLGLKQMNALENAIAMYSVIAWRILYMAHLVRHEPSTGCSAVFEKHEWLSTMKIVHGVDRDYREPSLSDFMIEVAKLGGYLNRKHDPPPGPQVLWTGLQKVDAYAQAWLAFNPSD